MKPPKRGNPEAAFEKALKLEIPATAPRTDVPEEEAQRFTGEAGGITPLAPGVPPPPPPPPPAVVIIGAPGAASDPPKAKPKASKLRRNESGERTVIHLPHHIATELRILCAKERRSLSDAVTEGVSMLLESRRSPDQKA